MTHLTLGEKLEPELRGTEGAHAAKYCLPKRREENNSFILQVCIEHLPYVGMVLGAGDIAKYSKISELAFLLGRQTTNMIF